MDSILGDAVERPKETPAAEPAAPAAPAPASAPSPLAGATEGRASVYEAPPSAGPSTARPGTNIDVRTSGPTAGARPIVSRNHAPVFPGQVNPWPRAGAVPGSDPASAGYSDVRPNEGAPLDLQIRVRQARNAKEAQAELEATLPTVPGQPPNYGQDYRGDWWYQTPEGDRAYVLPKYDSSPISGAIKNFLGEMAASRDPLAGGMMGAAAGRQLTSGLGPTAQVGGAAIGAGAGAAIGYGAEALEKAFRGTLHQDLKDIARGAAHEGAGMAIGEGALPLVSTALRGGMNAIRRKVWNLDPASPDPMRAAQAQRQISLTNEATAGAKGLSANGAATPPAITAVPEFSSLRAKQRVGRALVGNLAEDRNQAFLARMSQNILEDAGFSPAQAQQLIRHTLPSQAPQDLTRVGQLLQGASDAQRATYDQAIQDALVAARGALKAVEYDLKREATLGSKGLGKTLHDLFRNARSKFSLDMNSAYENVDRISGGAPVFNMDRIIKLAQEMRDISNPANVPGLVTRIADYPPGVERSIMEAHALRASVRQAMDMSEAQKMVGDKSWGELARIFEAFNEQFGILAATKVPGAQELRAVNAQYREGIKKFYMRGMQLIVNDARDGVFADPTKIAAFMMPKENAEMSAALMRMLPPEIKQQVRMADMANLLQNATSVDRLTGREEINPRALISMINDRKPLYSTLYSPQYLSLLEDLARKFNALDAVASKEGIPDLSGLAPGDVLNSLQRAVQVKQELAHWTAQNPLAALSSNDVHAVDSAYRQLVKPGNAATMEATMNALGGPNSPQWKEIRRLAFVHLLDGVYEPTSAAGVSINAARLRSNAMGQWSQKEIDMLFPGNINEDLVHLAEMTDFLFPGMGGKSLGAQINTGASLAAANILLNVPWRLKADIAFGSFAALTWLSTRPAVMRWIVNQQKANPGAGQLIWSEIRQMISTEMMDSGQERKK